MSIPARPGPKLVQPAGYAAYCRQSGTVPAMRNPDGTAHPKRLRVALFGAGRIGAVHASNIAAHPGAELAWVADPYPGAAAALADRYGATPATSADQVFDDTSLDAVLVASPTPTHLDLLYRAQAANLPAFCEKPLDLDLAAVHALAATLGASPAPIMVGFNRRFDPSFAAIWDRVRNGEIGAVEQLIIISRDPAPPPPAYVGGSGGIFRDCSIHDLDLARWFIGSIVSVHATGSNLFCDYIEQAGDFDSATITACGAAGEAVTVVNSRRCAFGYDQRLEVFGSAGMLTAGNVTPTSVRRYGPGQTGAADGYLPFFLERYAAAYAAELDSFITSVSTACPPSPSFADGLAALVLADAAQRSAATGQTVYLPGPAA